MKRKILSAIILVLLINVLSVGAQSEGLVSVTGGQIQGIQTNGVWQYLGVPYAEAAERFVPAQPVTPWNGIFMADHYGKISYQGTVVGMRGSNGANNDNNCQNLNIWTPAVNDGGQRPVMVWLHGGGFSTGSANESTYNGANLAKNQDVVVVGVNHRLNVFGHLDLSAYSEKYKASANVGIMDIQMALEWVRDNIAAFGGDPNNVTIFGQSGGGAKVLSMMTSPYAKGLFHKGIVQSGATEIMGVSFSSKEISLRIGELTLQNLEISPENADEIQNVSLDALLNASDAARAQTGAEYGMYLSLSTDYGIEWGPVIDGDYMPTAPVTETGFADAGYGIPLLIGSNFSEWTHWQSLSTHYNMTTEQINAFRDAYPMRDPLDSPYVDSFIRLPMLKIMSHKADQGGAEVYAYVYNYGSDPYHGIEISYVFGNNGSTLAAQMSRAWANFARTGVPSADGLPEWEPYTRENGATMLLDTQSQMVYHHDRELQQMLNPGYSW
jgi:para-nitrobenzyl esterase